MEYCKICGALKTNPAKCMGCPENIPPALWPVNQDAWAVWKEVETQWRGSGLGIVGLDYGEVRRVCRDLEIPYSTRNKRKIKTLEKVFLSHVNPAST